MNQHTGLTSALCHPSPIRPHPTMPRCQHLIFWLSNSINLGSEILFIFQLSNQLTDRLRKNNIKVLAEVRLQANDPKRAIRTIKVTVLVWPSLRTKCLSFVSSANSWKRSTEKTKIVSFAPIYGSITFQLSLSWQGMRWVFAKAIKRCAHNPFESGR